MPRSLGDALTVVALLVASVSVSAVAQRRDTTKAPVPRISFLVVTTRSLIALVPPSDTARFGQLLTEARAVAESLGFTLVLRTTPLEQVVDQAHAALYYVPHNLAVGYLLITPSLRPDAIPGLIGTDSLRVRLRAYLRIVRPLLPNPD